MLSSDLRSQEFQEEILKMLQPKIKSVLKQTDWQNRMDLEQEIYLMIVTVIKTRKFQKAPSFFELIESEKTATMAHFFE